MMEKRNVIENGRTPDETAKMAEVVDEGAAAFIIKTGDAPVPKEPPKEPDNDKAKPAG